MKTDHLKMLIAPDKFKGSLSAMEVCQAIGSGLKKCNPTIEITFHPMADGGDGSLEVLGNHLKLKKQIINTIDPLGRKISAQYFTSSNSAYIELASASGLVLLTETERNPMETSTFGTGKMIADAISKGYQNIFLFLGGSATNDVGMGIATALGCQFLDEHKNVLDPIGLNLSKVHFIKPSPLFNDEKIKMSLLCDVTNPLYGSDGAAYVYAAQKGATTEQIKYLDNGLKHFSDVVKKQFSVDVSTLSGVGAAGGIGASLIAIFGAKLEKGFPMISKITGLENQIPSADWVISGEGKLDEQSLQGKVITGISSLCKKHKKPLTLFVGRNDLSQQDIRNLNVHGIFSITENAKNQADAMLNGAAYLEQMAIQFYSHLNQND